MARGLAHFDPGALLALRTNHTDVDGTPLPLTAEALGALVGATKAQILAYENGHHTPDPRRIRALAKALRVAPQELMRHEGRASWDVAGIRRASGLRAQDIVKALSISPKSYRRFEAQGIVPVRRPRFLDDVASALGISHGALDRAISNIPTVRSRQRRTVDLIWMLAERYVYPPGTWQGPNASDPEIVELAVLYGRPPQRIRRVLSHVLEELRHKIVRMRREEVIAQYDPDRVRQQRAQAAVESWADLFHRELALIPDHLERFHRSAQPSDAWQVLVDLYEAEAHAADGPWVLAVLLAPRTVPLLPPSLVRRREFRGVAAVQLTHAGWDHVRRFAGLYAALHPGLRRPHVQPRSSSASRSFRLNFGPPVEGKQERFVIPPSSLEALLKKADSNGIVEVWPTPNVRLALPLLGAASTATARQSATIDIASPSDDSLF
ncbi:helix-turn-helix domain-containing protein [Streptomyces apocyni]|uniref:helix-turn-helix domain-containing protein n=1 Tax=Streptomyces apocyni TaxID=2654677 RepID=UPI0012EA10F3|nr:helix-turn-helix transcriptional regulator [Streptomyces apocyni]